jgi:N-hydroxyarylamine O-acetyltransferase
MNLNKYLERIEVDPHEVRPDLETLRLLQRQHLLHVPFENLDIHWGRPIILDADRFYKKIVESRRGGFCYELNGLFNELLKTVGFHTHLVSGRVYNAERKLGQEFDHMAIVVLLNGEEHLADVGFGDFIVEPLKIDPSSEQVDREGIFIVRLTEHGAFEVEKKDGDGWKPECLFGRNAHALQEFAGMCEFHQHSPDSHFTKGKLCSVLTERGRKTLTDTKFIVTEDDEKTELPVDSNDTFEKLLFEEFGIRAAVNISQ